MFISEIENYFLKTLKNSRGDSCEWVHPGKSPDGSPLRTFTFVRPGDPERVLISVSGTHGAEAYIGSNIQSEILENLTEKNLGRNPPTLIFIHNLNPFGSAWVRRVNHQNVDLNRNSWQTPHNNPNFDHYLDWLSSSSSLQFWSRGIPHFIQFPTKGLPRISTEMCGGQSHQPKSLFFAGTERAPELVHTQKFLSNFKPRRVFALEIHTGLGPFAHESMIQDKEASASLQAELERRYPKNLKTNSKSQGFYETIGTLEYLIRETFPQSEVLHITQEFGTRNFMTVLRSLTLENSAWHKGQRHDRKRMERLVEVFYPSEPEWQKSVRHSGVQRFFDFAKLI